jgi:hypothetical protein
MRTSSEKVPYGGEEGIAFPVVPVIGLIPFCVCQRDVDGRFQRRYRVLTGNLTQRREDATVNCECLVSLYALFLCVFAPLRENVHDYDATDSFTQGREDAKEAEMETSLENRRVRTAITPNRPSRSR